jgi:hypothetical protein
MLSQSWILFNPLPSTATNSPSISPLSSTRLKTREGKIHTLADTISNRQEARWVVYRIQNILGLTPKTRVEITAPGVIGLSRHPQQK